MITPTKTLLSTLCAAVFLAVAVSHVNAACVSLTSDLMQGSQDSSGQSVTALQTYLAASGYLSAKPTGYFGSLTFAAVKKFQAAQGINATGYVGPLTRAALQKLSCTATVQSAPTSVSTVVSAPVTTSSPVAPITSGTPVSTSAIIVTSPSSGATLTAGKSYTIQWTGKSNGTYNILLEDANGIGKGFIASNVYQANSYVWQVGNVTTSNNDSSWNPPLPSGTYRIHVVNASTGAQVSDVPSPTFSLVDTPLTLTSVSPSYVSSTASASGPTSVTVYGTRFDRTTNVTLQGMFTSTVYPSYVYPDGTQLIFYVPSGLATGKYGIGVSNTYGSFSSSAITLNVTN